MIPRDPEDSLTPSQQQPANAPVSTQLGALQPLTSRPEFETKGASPSGAAKAAPLDDRDCLASLDEQIRFAEANGDRAALANLHMTRAKEYLGAARCEDAALHLQACIRAAVACRNKVVHAAARIELADLAREAGDLTTACEHWQIARGLFFEVPDKDGVAVADGSMRRHGCPTDWVLTDF